jgi:hypothetical protein
MVGARRLRGDNRPGQHRLDAGVRVQLGCLVRNPGGDGAVPIGHQLHLLSSVVGVLAAIVSLFAFVVVDLRERAPRRCVTSGSSC